MSSGKPKKSQKLGSSRRYRNRNREIEEKENDDGFAEAENETHDSEQHQVHTFSENGAPNESFLGRSDQPIIACTNPSTSVCELSPHPQSQDFKDLLAQPEVTSKKRKIGSTRKSNRNYKFEGLYEDELEHRVQLSEGVSDEQEVTAETPIKENQSKEDQMSKSLLDCVPSKSLEHESSILQGKHLAAGAIMQQQHLEATHQSKPMNIFSSELNQSSTSEFSQDLICTSPDISINTSTKCNVPLQKLDESLQICDHLATLNKLEACFPNSTGQKNRPDTTYTPLNKNKEERQDVQLSSNNLIHNDNPSLAEDTVLKTMDNQSRLDFNSKDREREGADTLEGFTGKHTGQDEVTGVQSDLLVKECEHETQDDKVVMWENVTTKASTEDEDTADHSLEHEDETLKLTKESIYKEVSVAGDTTNSDSDKGGAAMEPNRNTISPLEQNIQEVETPSDQLLSYEFKFQCDSEMKCYGEEQYDLSEARRRTGESSARETIGKKVVDVQHHEEEKSGAVGIEREAENVDPQSTTSNELSFSGLTNMLDFVDKSELIPAKTPHGETETSSQTWNLQHISPGEFPTELKIQSREEVCSDQMHAQVNIQRSEFLDIETGVIKIENNNIKEETGAGSTGSFTKEDVTRVNDEKDGMSTFMNEHKMLSVSSNIQDYVVTDQASMVVKELGIKSPTHAYNTSNQVQLIPETQVKLDMQVYNVIATPEQKQDTPEECFVNPANKETKAEQFESTPLIVHIQQSRLGQDGALTENMRFSLSDKKCLELPQTSLSGLISGDDQKVSFKETKKSIQVQSLEDSAPISDDEMLSFTPEMSYPQSSKSLNITEPMTEDNDENMVKGVVKNEDTITSQEYNKTPQYISKEIVQQECSELDSQDEETVKIKNICSEVDTTHIVLSDVHEHLADTEVFNMPSRTEEADSITQNKQAKQEGEKDGQHISLKDHQSTYPEMKLGHSESSDTAEFAIITIKADHPISAKPMNAAEVAQLPEKNILTTDPKNKGGKEKNTMKDIAKYVYSNFSQATTEHLSPATVHPDLKEDRENNPGNVDNRKAKINTETKTKKKKKLESTQRPHGRHHAEEEEKELKDPENTEETEHQPSNLLTEAQSNMSEVTHDIHDPTVTTEQKEIIKSEIKIKSEGIEAPPAILSAEVEQIQTVVSDEPSNAEGLTDITQQNEKAGVNETKQAETVPLNTKELTPIIKNIQDGAVTEDVSLKVKNHGNESPDKESDSGVTAHSTQSPVELIPETQGMKDLQMDTEKIHPVGSDQNQNISKEHEENPTNKESEPEQNKNTSLFVKIEESKSSQSDVALTTTEHLSPATEHPDYKKDDGISPENVDIGKAEINTQTQTKKKKKIGSTRRPHGRHHAEEEEKESKDTENTEEFKHQPSNLLTETQSNMSEVTHDIPDSTVTTEQKEIIKSEMKSEGIEAPPAILSAEVEQIQTVVSDEPSNAEGLTDITQQNEKAGVNETKQAETVPLNTKELAPIIKNIQDGAVTEDVSLKVKNHGNESPDKESDSGVTAYSTQGPVELIPETQGMKDLQMGPENIYPVGSDQNQKISKEHVENPTNRESEPEQVENSSPFVKIEESKSSQSDVALTTTEHLSTATEHPDYEKDNENNPENVDNRNAEINPQTRTKKKKRIGSTRRPHNEHYDEKEEKELKDPENTEEFEHQPSNLLTETQSTTRAVPGDIHDPTVTTEQKQLITSEGEIETGGNEKAGVNKRKKAETELLNEQEKAPIITKTQDLASTEHVSLKVKNHGNKDPEKESDSDVTAHSTCGPEELIPETQAIRDLQVGPENIHSAGSGQNQNKSKEHVENLTNKESEPEQVENTSPFVKIEESKSSQSDVALTTAEHLSPATEHPDYKKDDGISPENVDSGKAEINTQTQTKKKKKIGSTRKPHGRHHAEEEEKELKDPENTEEIEHQPSNQLTETQGTTREVTHDIHDLTVTTEQKQMITSEGGIETGATDAPPAILSAEVEQIQTVVSDEPSNAEGLTDITQQNEKAGVNETKEAETVPLNEKELAPIFTNIQDGAVTEDVSLKVKNHGNESPDKESDSGVTAHSTQSPVELIPETQGMKDLQMDTEKIHPVGSDQNQKISKEHEENPTNRESEPEQNKNTSLFVKIEESKSSQSDVALTTTEHLSPATEHPDYKKDDGISPENVDIGKAEINTQTQTKKKKKIGSTRRPHGRHHTEEEEKELKDTENTEEIEHQPSNLLTETQSTTREVPGDIHDPTVTTEQKQLITSEGEIETGGNEKAGVNKRKKAETELLNEQEKAPIITKTQDLASTEHVSLKVKNHGNKDPEKESDSDVTAHSTCGPEELIPETQAIRDLQVGPENIHSAGSGQNQNKSKEHVENPTDKESEPEQVENTSPFVKIEESKSSQSGAIRENMELISSEKRKKIGSTRKSLRGQILGRDQKNEIEEMKEKEPIQEQTMFQRGADTGDIEEKHNDTKEEANAGPSVNVTEEDITTICSQPFIMPESFPQATDLALTTAEHLSPATEHPDYKKDDGISPENVDSEKAGINTQTQTKKKKKIGSTRKPHGRHHAEEAEREWKDTEFKEEIEHQIITEAATSNLLTEIQSTMSEVTHDIHDSTITTEQKQMITSEGEIGTGAIDAPPSILSAKDDQIHTVVSAEVSYSEGLTDITPQDENAGVNEEKNVTLTLLNEQKIASIITQIQDDDFTENVSLKVKNHGNKSPDKESDSEVNAHSICHPVELIPKTQAMNDLKMDSENINSAGSDQIHEGDQKNKFKEIIEEKNNDTKQEVSAGYTENFTEKDITTACSQQYMLPELSPQTTDVALTTTEHWSPATEHPDFTGNTENSPENVKHRNAEIHRQSRIKKKKKFGSTRRPHGRPCAEEENEDERKDVDNTEEIQIIDQAAASNLLTELQSAASGLLFDTLKSPLRTKQVEACCENEGTNNLYHTHGPVELISERRVELDMPVVYEQYRMISEEHLENPENRESEPEQCESTHPVVHIKDLKLTHNSADTNSGRRKKMGSTRRSLRVMKEKENIQELTTEESTPTSEKDHALNLTIEKSSQSIQTHSEPPNSIETEAEKLGSACKNLEKEQSIQEAWQKTKAMDSKYAGNIDMLNPDSIFCDTETRVQQYELQIHSKPDQSEGSLLSEIEFYLNKSTENTLSTSFLNPNISELSEPMSESFLQLSSSQNPQSHMEPSSPARRRKMGSSRKTSKNKHAEDISSESIGSEQEKENLDKNNPKSSESKSEAKTVKETVTGTEDIKKSVKYKSEVQALSQINESSTQATGQALPEGRRRFGSRRTPKGSRGLGAFTDDDYESNQEKTDLQESKDDLRVPDPHFILQPESTPISHPVPEHKPGTEEVKKAVVKDISASTEAGLVSLDNILKTSPPSPSTGGRQKIDFEQIPDFGVAVYNIVMVGNCNVGKTSFIKRLQSGRFIPDYSATIGVDTFVQTVTFGNRTVKLYVWDTAGQERYHSITRQVFHKAQGLLLMYDVTSSQSFQAVRAWISQVQEKASPDVILMLLGNKNDCAPREVQLKEGEDLAKEYNIHFMECSAATGENVSESMKTLAWLLVKQRVRKEEEHPTLQSKPQNKKSGCC